MSTKQVWIDLPFADGVYRFALPSSQMTELQDKRGCGIFELYGRVMKGRHVMGDQVVALPMDGAAYHEDMAEIVRLGLIGGNQAVVAGDTITVSSQAALQLVENYVRPRPLAETWAIAGMVLTARIMGIEAEDAAKLAANDLQPRPPRK